MSHPLRVLQLIDSLVPAGAERSLAVLAPHLLALGVDLQVGYYTEREGLRGELERSGVRVTSLDVGQHRRARVRRTAALLHETKPDVVHTTLFEADLAGRRAAARVHVPCVSSLVNTAYGRIESGAGGRHLLKMRAAQAVDAVTARHVTRFHAVTQHVAHVMGRRLGISAERIEVISRGRDPRLLGRRTPQRSAATRQRLGIPIEAPLIVAIGRQEPQKGLDVLLRALPSVRRAFPDVRVLVAGRDGRATESLKHLVHETALHDAVSFLGARDDVPDLLAAADVFAFPSLWEGAGGTLLEAMALECPIVSSDLATLRETVDPATALLVPPSSPQDLSIALITALTYPHDAKRRAVVAAHRFREYFTIEGSAMRMKKLYDNVATI